ncbi:hypothetical protein BKA82DRAFT_897651 [Pisolithus tinctorius]|uniref:Citrate transporter-like domain-containing protein n=1 Tax=Pisolithus tinctorius Marx 270 TaxID=870435 RepID=A0A0C3N8D0_PISTI|nr:hypothetical protein BKA82DRAFT_897651 [Pisolithus tinctorius]KIN97314.1 hypothetical protein M404DRAFT_897651 [Pisolithus tinctorius Marx 270]
MDGYAIATLVIFTFSIVFVIYPVSIRTPVRSIPRVPFNLTTAPILAIVVLLASGCIDPAVIRDGIVGTGGVKPYNILIQLFSLAYMTITLNVTGIFAAAAFWVKNKSGSNGRKLHFYSYVMLTLLSIPLGNDPVILSGTAFLAYYTAGAGVAPMPWLMSEFAAANTASMVLFVGNPTNVVICEGFGVNNVAFTTYTVLPFIACNIVCFGALAAQYHTEQYIPHKLDRRAEADPRSVLHNPMGAFVGSILLCSALVVCSVVSFFGIDVWKTSLPFAVAKFIFDLAWDHYCFCVTTDLPRRVVNNHPGEYGLPSSSESQSTARKPNRRKRLMMETSNREPQYQNSLGLTSSSKPRLTAMRKLFTYYHTISRAAPQLTLESLVPRTITTQLRSWLSGRQHLRSRASTMYTHLRIHFPTFFTALPRLPFTLLPFAFSQFILIQALAHRGWVNVFADWLVKATHNDMYATIWLIGALGVVLCNVAGTNIGATILLTKVANAAALPSHSARAAAIALAVVSNIGAVSFTFSASLAGLLWKDILAQRGIFVRQRDFAYWNSFPLLVMTVTGLAVVCAEMAVLYQPSGA